MGDQHESRGGRFLGKLTDGLVQALARRHRASVRPEDRAEATLTAERPGEPSSFAGLGDLVDYFRELVATGQEVA
jgi:hypothetical protein